MPESFFPISRKAGKGGKVVDVAHPLRMKLAVLVVGACGSMPSLGLSSLLPEQIQNRPLTPTESSTDSKLCLMKFTTFFFFSFFCRKSEADEKILQDIFESEKYIN